MIYPALSVALDFSPEFLSACCLMGGIAELSTLCGGWEL